MRDRNQPDFWELFDTLDHQLTQARLTSRAPIAVELVDPCRTLQRIVLKQEMQLVDLNSRLELKS